MAGPRLFGWVFRIWRDERGTLLSSEYLILGTILTIGLIVGIHAAQNSLVSELEDYAAAISRLWSGNGGLDGPNPVTFEGHESGNHTP